jgi:hypothetical protein
LVTDAVTVTARSASGHGAGDRDVYILDPEGRVREAKPKRIAHLLNERVVRPISDEDALAVPHEALLAGEVEVGRVVLQAYRDGFSQLAGGVGNAQQQIDRGSARSLSRQPAFQDRGDPVVPC